MENNIQSEDFGQDFDLKAELSKYIIHWKWFVVSIGIVLFIAFLKIRYTSPIYSASAKILMKDTKRGGRLSEAAAFSDLGINSGTRNVDDEIEIMKSRTLSESVIKKLNFNISLISHGKVLDVELFEDAPIEIHFINQVSDFYEKSMLFDFLENASGTFTLESNELLGTKKQFHYGESIKTKYGDLIVTQKNTAKEVKVPALSIVVSPVKNVAASYRARLTIDPLTKGSSVVVLGMMDAVGKKAELFLDYLVQAYNEKAIADKEFISKNTSVFVSNRLELISKELAGVEKDVEHFKVNNNLTDLESESALFTAASTEYDKKAIEIQVQLNVLNSVLEYVKKSNNENLLPANLFSDVEGDASSLISSYNDMILDRNRMLQSATVSNPTLVKLDQQLSSLKSTLLSSLAKSKSMLQIQKKTLKKMRILLMLKNKGFLLKNANLEILPVNKK